MKFILFDRRLLTNFDWFILLVTILISCIGVITIYSATGTGLTATNLYMKQIYWMLYSLIFLIISLTIDYHHIERYAYFLYAVMVCVLIVVLTHGKIAGGAQRWLNLGFINIQPSELSKIIMVIVLAKYFDDTKNKIPYNLADLIPPAIIVAIPFMLIAKQPDLGTGIIFLIIFLSISLIAGIEKRSLLILIALSVVVVPSLWFFLKDYQKNRILTLYNPEIDPLGAGYHVIQSKIAIGSGGFTGKGLLSGTQSQLNFLPEKHTDFIFAVFSEELGFAGSLVLILLFVFLILKGIDIIYNAKDIFGALLATGCVAIFGSHVIINIAMTTGLFPIVGIPLPLMSYGGSFTITSYVAIGILLNIKMRKFISK
jgi:rod shape determining protein RodA